MIVRRVDHSHAAAPERALDLEAIAQQARSRLERRRYRPRRTVGDSRSLAQKRVIRPIGGDIFVVLAHIPRHAVAMLRCDAGWSLCFDDIVTTDDEQELRRSWDDADFCAVTTLALKRYGPEILGVLAARLRSASDAADVFSLFAEDLWRGLPNFQWRCNLRAWAYRIALNAATRWAAGGARRPERNVSIEQSSVLELAERVRSSTLVHLRTEVKSEVRRLREELPEFEQMLIILRVDKALEWPEIAAALAAEDLAADEVKREAARLRKRFQLVTEKLRELARERGILDR